MYEASVPTLLHFDEEHVELIFGQRKTTLFLFRDEKDANEDYTKTFELAAKELKG